MAKTTIRCPECGAAFEIPAKTLLGVIGNVLGEDSDMGDVYLKEKTDEPRKPLRDSKGHFVSNATSEKFASDMAKAANESLSEEVRKQGTVPNKHMFRRWITAQIFRLIRGMDLGHDSFAGQVRDRGIRYMWKVIENEVKDIETIKKNGDLREVNRRMRWWNSNSIYKIVSDYWNDVQKQIGKLKQHKCKGRPYVTIPGIGMVFVDDLGKRVITRFCKELADMDKYGDADHVIKCIRAFSAFKESNWWDVKMPTSFINAYKGAGAYFALRNLIMFHDCQLEGMVGDEALADLDALAEQARDEGWKMVGLLKEVLAYNHIDINEKFHEWAEAKRKRLGH